MKYLGFYLMCVCVAWDQTQGLGHVMFFKQLENMHKTIMNMLILKIILNMVYHRQENWKHNLFFWIVPVFFFIYCSAGWGYTVTFTKVLTMYQIFHS
jgi:hypothetical protein